MTRAILEVFGIVFLVVLGFTGLMAVAVWGFFHSTDEADHERRP